MTAKQKILTGAAAMVLLGVPVYQQTRINSLNDEVAALSDLAPAQTRKVNSPVVVSTSDQRQPSARPVSSKGKTNTRAAAAPRDEASTAGEEIIARVSVPGPGEAVFARRGSGVILESFRAEEGAGLIRGGGFGAAPFPGAVDNLSPRAPRTTAGHVHWDHAQATGAPNTPEAGDRPTAWAPRSSKSGEQWLQLGYDKAVEMKEINIHESYNKGAISKVTAFLPDGTEKTLWTGNVAPPDSNEVQQTNEVQETSVPVPRGITSNQIKVYVDTNRVGSWPEIDAVELVGRDGSRQWASQSSASSSYSENYSNQAMEIENLPIERRVRNP